MKTHPLPLIDEENDDNSHISSNHLKKLKSLNQDDTSTENTFNTLKQKKIIFDFRNKFNNENLIDDTNEEPKREENNIQPKKENLSNNLIEKRDKKFSYHGKIYFFSACIMLLYQYLSYIYLIEIPIIFTNNLNILYLFRIIVFHILIILLSNSLLFNNSFLFLYSYKSYSE